MPVLKRKTPADYGAPANFKSFRPGQLSAIRHGVRSPARFVIQAMPTGSGKSLNAILQALDMSSRALYLTSTKGLQDQLLADFRSIGLVDARGQSNYQCIDVADGKPKRTVDEGECHFGYGCDRIHRYEKGEQGIQPRSPYRDPCLYYNAIEIAHGKDLVVTNYSFWMHHIAQRNRRKKDKKLPPMVYTLGTFDLLVLDEAHSALGELSSFLAIEFTHYDFETLMECDAPTGNDEHNWIAWAKEQKKRIEDKLLWIQGRIENGEWSTVRKEANALRRLLPKLESLTVIEGGWVREYPDPITGIRVRFDVVSPHLYAESVLFDKVPNVLLLGATLRPKIVQQLGIPQDDYSFREYPHTFPVSNRPTYCVDTVRLSSKSTPADYTTWVRRIDQIINTRQDRKGVIHTGSYARRDLVLAKSDFAHMMVTHQRRDTARVVEQFQQSRVPQILVSPSVTTGYDFPGSQCEYQIIGKVPFPDMRPAVMAARKKRDPEYDAYIAMQQIVQAAGRGVRSTDDRCEVFIIDNHWMWFSKKFAHLAPKWFLDSCTFVRTIPRPPRVIRRK